LSLLRTCLLGPPLREQVTEHAFAAGAHELGGLSRVEVAANARRGRYAIARQAAVKADEEEEDPYERLERVLRSGSTSGSVPSPASAAAASPPAAGAPPPGGPARTSPRGDLDLKAPGERSAALVPVSDPVELGSRGSLLGAVGADVDLAQVNLQRVIPGPAGALEYPQPAGMLWQQSPVLMIAIRRPG